MNNLLELTSDHRRVSIVGMCKNSGKTTVLNRLISDCRSAGLIIALCSVGRDGEKTDVVTRTEKPAIFVHEGTLFATTRALLACCEVEKELLLSTGVSTALGEVVVYRALCSGFIELSGPSINAQLPALLDYFMSNGAEKVLIDGAVSRKASSAPINAGCTILCTGADYNPNMARVVEDTTHIAQLLSTEALQDDKANALIAALGAAVVAIDKDYNPAVCGGGGSIPKPDMMAARYVYFPGALTDRVCEDMLGGGFHAEGLGLVSDYAAKLMISSGCLKRLKSRGVKLYVLNPVKLACICINPHSTSGQNFDKDLFLSEMQRVADVPVINAMEEDNGFEANA
jgi:hypothetical protein